LNETILLLLSLSVWAVSRQSEKSLYDQELASMDVHGQFSPYSATGFIEINATRIKQYNFTYGIPNMK
jgi:argininosuccinate synthase